MKKKLLIQFKIFQGDIEVVKAAVCSALDVMQAMGSSLCSVLSQVKYFCFCGYHSLALVNRRGSVVALFNKLIIIVFYLLHTSAGYTY